jgi:hypothetical protein
MYYSVIYLLGNSGRRLDTIFMPRVINESDWTIFRNLQAISLERFCHPKEAKAHHGNVAFQIAWQASIACAQQSPFPFRD